MKLLDYLLAIPKTLYFNLRVFGLRGLKCPILVSHHTVLKSIKGQFLLPDRAKTASVRIGFGDVPIFERSRSRPIVCNDGTIEFKGRAKIGHGGKIVVKKGAQLTFGHRFNMSAESAIYCCHSITFGDYNLMSWQVLVIDSDLHDIYEKDTKVPINHNAAVQTGESVWLGMRSTVLKGVSLPNDTIIAANSNVTQSHKQPNAIYGGNPAKLIKENICWDSAKRDYISSSPQNESR